MRVLCQARAPPRGAEAQRRRIPARAGPGRQVRPRGAQDPRGRVVADRPIPRSDDPGRQALPPVELGHCRPGTKDQECAGRGLGPRHCRARRDKVAGGRSRSRGPASRRRRAARSRPREGGAGAWGGNPCALPIAPLHRLPEPAHALPTGGRPEHTSQDLPRARHAAHRPGFCACARPRNRRRQRSYATPRGPCRRHGRRLRATGVAAELRNAAAHEV